MHNSPEWDIIDFACYTSKITHVSLHPLTDFELVKRVIRELEPGHIFISHKFNLRRLQGVLNATGLKVQLVPLQNQADLQQFYASLSNANVTGTERGVNQSADEFLQTIIYTSGSTGIAKGVMLSDKNMQAAMNMFAAAEFFDGCKTALSLLPIGLSGERKLNYAYKARGITICYPSAQQSLKEAFAFFKPDIIAVVPYLLEKIKSLLEAGTIDLTFLKAIVCGGAAISTQTQLFFKQKNIPLYQLYGLTETASVLSFNDAGNTRLSTVGKVPPDMQVKIAEDGEILCKGPNVTRGYFNEPEHTQTLLNEDGWLRTGDLGEFDADGFLKITGRKKNGFKTSRGVYILPEPLEQKLGAHPLIQNALVMGENSNYLSAVLLLNAERSPTQTEEILANWVRQCNLQFQKSEQIYYLYIICKKEWEGAAFLTLSLKPDRKAVSQAIADKEPIALYSPQDED